MGIVTTADEASDSLKINVYNALQDCNKILDADTWGNDDLSKVYLQKINDIRSRLQDIEFSLR